MKRYFIFVILSIISLKYISIVQAASPTLTPLPQKTVSSAQKNEALSKQINDLKEKIASKVAQLNLVEKRGIVGKVTEVSNTVITIEDLNKNIRLIDVDQITKFSLSDDKESIGISDIKKGQFISILGTYNKNTKRILARFISIENVPSSLSGDIINIDKQNFTITLLGTDKTPKIIDIEKITTIYLYKTDEILRKSGFSKIALGYRAILLGIPHKTEKNRFSADTLLLLSNLPKNTER